MKQKDKIWVSRGAYLLFWIYVVFLIYFLFFSTRYGRTDNSGDYRCNLELFREIKRFIKYRDIIGTEGFIVNIIGNVLAFAPFGFLFPIISSGNRKFSNMTILSLEFSLTIEIMQLLLKVGSFDVDDIFLNTIGGMLGYLLFVVCWSLFRKKRSK